MPTYDIQTPGGRVLTIEAPDEAQALAGAQQWHAQQGQAPAEPEGDSALNGIASAGARGVNKALTDIVGAPVDLVNWGLGKVGLGTEQPFGGSTSIRAGLDRLAQVAGMSEQGRMAYERRNEVPEDYRWAAAGGEAVGSSLPFAGAIGKAAQGVALADAALPTGNALKDAASGLVRSAAQNPTRFAAAEAAAAQGGAQGAAIGQLLDNDGEMGVADCLAAPFSRPNPNCEHVKPQRASRLGAVPRAATLL